MKYLIITGNPKKDGLCASVMSEVKRGAEEGGAEVEVLDVSKLERCHVCGTGWGQCLKQHTCAFGKDGFSEAQDKVRAADQFCFITPVYWWEMAESLKCFFDRLRRCEFDYVTGDGSASLKEAAWKPALSGKQVLLVASPGDTGNGAIPCLDQMNRFCQHVGAVVFDCIGINRWNNDYKKAAAYASAKAMASGRKAGVTL